MSRTAFQRLWATWILDKDLPGGRPHWRVWASLLRDMPEIPPRLEFVAIAKEYEKDSPRVDPKPRGRWENGCWRMEDE